MKKRDQAALESANKTNEAIKKSNATVARASMDAANTNAAKIREIAGDITKTSEQKEKEIAAIFKSAGFSWAEALKKAYTITLGIKDQTIFDVIGKGLTTAPWDAVTGYINAKLVGDEQSAARALRNIDSYSPPQYVPPQDGPSRQAGPGPQKPKRAAAGGYIRGPGSPTSDSIDAKLSDGEYVVKQSSVKKYGVPFMHAVNEGKLPGFAGGGLVNAIYPPLLKDILYTSMGNFLNTMVKAGNKSIPSTVTPGGPGEGGVTYTYGGSSKGLRRPWPNATLRWAQEAERGARKWYNLCLRFARMAIGVPARYPTAQSAWNHIPPSRRHRGDAPAGYPEWWNTGKGRAGHVGISDGRGNVYSNDILKHGKIDLVPRTRIHGKWGATYLGWSSNLNGVDLPTPIEHLAGNLTSRPATGSQGRTGSTRAMGGLIEAGGNIPIVAKTGEYMVNGGAVKQYGTGMMDAINAKQYHTGGLVTRQGPKAGNVRQSVDFSSAMSAIFKAKDTIRKSPSRSTLPDTAANRRKMYIEKMTIEKMHKSKLSEEKMRYDRLVHHKITYRDTQRMVPNVNRDRIIIHKTPEPKNVPHDRIIQHETNVTFNISEAGASADQIASVVMAKMKVVESRKGVRR